MSRIFFTALVLVLTVGVSHAAKPLSAIKTGDLSAVTFPDDASTPDGMTVAKDGKIYLNTINLQVPAVAAVWTLDAKNRLEKLIDLPPHPETEGVYPWVSHRAPTGTSTWPITRPSAAIWTTSHGCCVW